MQIYNIGQTKEEVNPKVKGSSVQNGDGPRGFTSSNNSIRNPSEEVNQNYSFDDALLVESDPDYADTLSGAGKMRDVTVLPS